MKRIIAMVLLIIGIGLAAAYGARNGDQHTDFRAAQWAVSAAENDGARVEAEKTRDSIGMPPPKQRFNDWFNVGGFGWLAGIAFIVVGAGLARQEMAADAASGGEGGAVDFVKTVQDVVVRITELEQRLETLAFDEDAPDARAKVDAIMSEQVEPLVDGRGQLIAIHGLAVFAQYFGPFSGGERNLGRCWSALTDGHADEARASAANARREFETALDAYAKVEASA